MYRNLICYLRCLHSIVYTYTHAYYEDTVHIVFCNSGSVFKMVQAVLHS